MATFQDLTRRDAAFAAADAGELEDARSVLAVARRSRREADAAEAQLLRAAAAWADLHPAESLSDAATLGVRGADTDVPVAGPGAPRVTEFCLAEFAAAVGLSTTAGRFLVGHALELRHRLPRTWARIHRGDLPVWRARKIADATLALTSEAATYVDRQVAPVAHRIGPAALDRLVQAAIAQYMPDEADKRRRDAADRRHVDIDTDQVSYHGTSRIEGELDLADALDLDAALGNLAAARRRLGDQDPLDVRRAKAAGDLARRQLTLDLQTAGTGPDTGTDGDGGTAQGDAGRPVSRQRRPAKPRQVVLYVHLHEAALHGAPGIGRVENTRSPVTTEQIRDWCGQPDAQVVVKPVIDLTDHVHVGAYEIPDRIREHVALRDPHCVFPFCTRPTRSCRTDEHPCDTDHGQPYDAGGPTCTCNLVPLCRRHHRLKTHTSWRYTILEPGTYLWASPHGDHYLVDHTGTQHHDPDRYRPEAADPRRPPDH